MNLRISSESLIYLFGQILLVGIGFSLKYFQTGSLGPEAFGEFTFINSFVAFSIIFFQFGYMPTLKLLLAESEGEFHIKRIVGFGFLMTLILGLIFSQFILVASFFVDSIFDTQVSDLLLILSPLFFSIMFVHFFSAVGMGLGKLHISVFFELGSRLLFLCITMYLYFNQIMSVWNVVLFNLLSHSITIVVFYWVLKPEFNDLKSIWQLVKEKHKSFGRDYYIGSIANQGTFKLDDLMITAWVSPIQLGFYALARMVTSPISMASVAINNALFKSYSSLRKIPERVFLINTSICLIALVGINIFGEWAISWLFGPEYAQTAHYILIFSFASFFMGMYQPFNFLTAKGLGHVVRNTALTESVVNILGNLILIPIIGVWGALYTTLAARFVHFIMKWFYYYQYLKASKTH